MKDFKSYRPSAKEDVESFLKSKSGQGEDELMAELFERAKEGRKNGTLSDREIDRFVEQIAPMLSEAQRVKLSVLVGKLKRI